MVSYLYFTDDRGTSVYDARTLECNRVRLKPQKAVIDISDEEVSVYVCNKRCLPRRAAC